MAAEYISGVLHGFKEFIHEKSVLEHDGEITITYTPFSYDLVDADLDFDETYYNEHLVPNFEKLLETEAVSQMLNIGPAIKRIVIHRGNMVFRNHIVQDKKVSFERDGTTVRVTRSTYETIELKTGG